MISLPISEWRCRNEETIRKINCSCVQENMSRSLFDGDADGALERLAHGAWEQRVLPASRCTFRLECWVVLDLPRLDAVPELLRGHLHNVKYQEPREVVKPDEGHVLMLQLVDETAGELQDPDVD